MSDDPQSMFTKDDELSRRMQAAMPADPAFDLTAIPRVLQKIEDLGEPVFKDLLPPGEAIARAAETLSDTEALLDSRKAVYEDRVDNMKRTAMIWSGFLGFTIEPWQVPVMMSLYKIFRMSSAHDYSNNIDDADGWLKMFREVMGDDLIQARTVEEYLQKKNAPTIDDI